MIDVNQLIKHFKAGHGIHGLNFTVAEGEAFGFVGPNGAGKSTTIRCLMGFIRPTQGYASIAGHHCWEDALKIHRVVGYIPGEVVLPENLTGQQFLRDIQGLRGIHDRSRLDRLITRFDMDPGPSIRHMSKGTRQKLAIIAALLHDPAVLILDEPTSGLDPLMQQVFIEIMHEEHERGKTIFLSSHIFSEIERICDRVAILKAGEIVALKPIAHLRAEQETLFDVTLSSPPTGDLMDSLRVVDQRGLVWTVAVQGDYATFFSTLATLPVVHLQQRTQDLETLFQRLYAEEVTSL